MPEISDHGCHKIFGLETRRAELFRVTVFEMLELVVWRPILDNLTLLVTKDFSPNLCYSSKPILLFDLRVCQVLRLSFLLSLNVI